MEQKMLRRSLRGLGIGVVVLVAGGLSGTVAVAAPSADAGASTDARWWCDLYPGPRRCHGGPTSPTAPAPSESSSVEDPTPAVPTESIPHPTPESSAATDVPTESTSVTPTLVTTTPTTATHNSTGSLSWTASTKPGREDDDAAWIVTGPDGSRAPVVDNGINDADQRPGVFALAGLVPGAYVVAPQNDAADTHRVVLTPENPQATLRMRCR